MQIRPPNGNQEVGDTTPNFLNGRIDFNFPKDAPHFHIPITLATESNSGGAAPPLWRGTHPPDISFDNIYIVLTSHLDLSKPIFQIRPAYRKLKADDISPLVLNTRFNLGAPRDLI